MKLLWDEMKGEAMMRDEVAFKISFLRAMAPIMAEPDLDTFQGVCKHFEDQVAVMADLVLLDYLFKKFEGRKNEIPK